MFKLKLSRKKKKERKKEIKQAIDVLNFKSMDKMLEINGLLGMKEEKDARL